MGWRDKRAYRDRPERIRKNTHPPLGQHDAIIRAWYGDLRGPELADRFGVAPITIYSLWCRAKKAGKLPKTPRVMA